MLAVMRLAHAPRSMGWASIMAKAHGPANGEGAAERQPIIAM